MTTERHKLIDPSRIDDSLLRHRFSRLTKAELVDRAIDGFEREVDLLNDNDQLRRERNEEALARLNTEGELALAQARIADLEDSLITVNDRANLYRGLLRTVSQAMGPRLQGAFRRGRLSVLKDLREIREKRAQQSESWPMAAAKGVLSYAERTGEVVFQFNTSMSSTIDRRVEDSKNRVLLINGYWQ